MRTPFVMTHMWKKYLIVGLLGLVASMFLGHQALCQSAQQGVRLFKEAMQLAEKAKTKQDAEKIAQLYEEALKIFQNQKIDKAIAAAAHNAALWRGKLGDLPRALELYGQSLAIYEKSGEQEQAGWTLINMAILQFIQGRYEANIESLQKAEVIFRKLGKEDGLANVYQEMGITRRNQGKYDEAAGLHEKALALYRKLGDESAQAKALQGVALVHEEHGDYGKALEEYSKALAIAKKLGDQDLETGVTHNTAVVYTYLGKYREALAIHEKNLALRKGVGDISGEAKTLGCIAGIYHGLSRYNEAVEFYEKAMAIEKRLGDLGGQAQELNNLAGVYKRWSKYSKALELYQESLDLFKKIGNEGGEIAVISNMASVYDQLGLEEKAREMYEKSLSISRKLGKRADEATALGNIASMYSESGNYAKASEFYEKSLKIKQGIGDLPGQASSIYGKGDINMAWGRYSEAHKLYGQALAIRKELGDVSGQGDLLNSLGILYQTWGFNSKAVEYYEQSLEIAKRLGEVSQEGRLLGNLGIVYSLQGDYAKAEDNFRRTLELWSKLGKPTKWPNALLGDFYLDVGDTAKAEPFVKAGEDDASLGRFYLMKSEYVKARESYERLLSSPRTSEQIESVFVAYTGLGKVHEAMEEYKKAEEYYEKGMKLTEDLRSGLLPAERKNFFEVTQYGFQRSEPAKGLTRVRMKLNESSGSIDSSEMTRARAFSDNIAQTTDAGPSGIPKEILQREDELVSKVAAVKKQLAKVDKDESKATYENLSRQLQDAQKELSAFIEMLWKDYTRYASVKYPRPVTLQESALLSEENVVIFDVSTEGVGVKLIKGKKIARTFYTEWKSEDLEGDVKRFRRPFENMKLEEFDSRLGNDLYKKLLAAVLMDVPDGAPIVIIPDGILAVLPFEALVVSGQPVWKEEGGKVYPEGLTYLGDTHPISYYQSISALTLARKYRSDKKPGGKTLVIADPVFAANDPRLKENRAKQRGKMVASLPETLMSIKGQSGLHFPRLALTSELAEYLKKQDPDNTDLFVGLQAKKSLLFAKPISEYGRIVFATHGYFGADIPGIREPVLALTLVDQAKDQDGFLRMTEVMGMKLSADVVALTACQTGVGSNLAGEGVMSMGRAFQYAGAKSILMSLWSVSESGSVLLVEKFFGRLNSGKSKLEALKLAREDVRNAGYKHPFYWAPFILVGETD